MDYTRQRDLVPIEKLKATHVNLVGAGGIGSPAAIALAKMGIGHLSIWDDDRVEAVNLPNQFHTIASIDMPKVESVRKLIHEFSSSIEVVTYMERIVPQTIRILEGILVAAVDSMESRRNIWGQIQISPRINFFVDARLGGELLRLYALNPHDTAAGEAYEATLYSDEESLELPCTARSIIYTGLIAGGLITHAVKKFIAGEETVFEVVLDLTSFTLLIR